MRILIVEQDAVPTRLRHVSVHRHRVVHPVSGTRSSGTHSSVRQLMHTRQYTPPSGQIGTLQFHTAAPQLAHLLPTRCIMPYKCTKPCEIPVSEGNDCPVSMPCQNPPVYASACLLSMRCCQYPCMHQHVLCFAVSIRQRMRQHVRRHMCCMPVSFIEIVQDACSSRSLPLSLRAHVHHVRVFFSLLRLDVGGQSPLARLS